MVNLIHKHSKRFYLALAFLITLTVLAIILLAGAPYRWPSDTGGDPSVSGEDANGWSYYVDHYFPDGTHEILPMVWDPASGTWKDPTFGDETDARVVKEGNVWKIIADVLGTEPDQIIINPKLALHPDIDNDIPDGQDTRNMRLSINARALPGGCSMRVFICHSDIDGHPDPTNNRRDIAGTADEPLIYEPDAPITGSWPISIGREGTDADMHHCDWIIFEFDDPETGTPGAPGGVTWPPDPPVDDDTIDDDTIDDDTIDDDTIDDDTADDDDDDDDTWVNFEEDACPLLSELVVVVTAKQFVEIHNPTDRVIYLDQTYVSNSPLYYGVVTQDNTVDTLSGAGGYFNAKFPDGAIINPGEYQTISLYDGTQFLTDYGVPPTYVLHTGPYTIMIEAFPGSINTQGALRVDGADVMVYVWNGRSDLIKDCDYAIYGDKVDFVDKSLISIDGIDPDATPSPYNSDMAAVHQKEIAPQAHADGDSFNRCDNTEGAEVKSGPFNGYMPAWHDETSEDLNNTWMALTPPSPNAAPNCNPTDDDTTDDDTGDDDTGDDDTDDDDTDDDDDDDDDTSSGIDDDDDDDDCGGCGGCRL